MWVSAKWGKNGVLNKVRTDIYARLSQYPSYSLWRSYSAYMGSSREAPWASLDRCWEQWWTSIIAMRTKACKLIQLQAGPKVVWNEKPEIVMESGNLRIDSCWFGLLKVPNCFGLHTQMLPQDFDNNQMLELMMDHGLFFRMKIFLKCVESMYKGS